MVTCRAIPNARDERGTALVLAMMATALLMATGLGLALITTTELVVASNYRGASEARYAADAGVERALDELIGLSDWTPLLQGSLSSMCTDGAPSGTRPLGDGTAVDLTAIVNLANCARVSDCSPADMDAVTSDRPWGPNNPRWRLFAYGPLHAVAGGVGVRSSMYVAILVADDPAETDDDPAVDGAPGNSGAGIIEVRAEAFGAGGLHAAVEATLVRTASSGVRLASWRILR